MKIKGIETDFPEQFKNRKNLTALCVAFNRQFTELADVFQAVCDSSDIDRASGAQLDKIGDIVGLTRAQAGLLCGQTIYFDVVDDERYRRYLKYKAFRNSNDCTYYSLITSLKAILGNDVQIEYREDKEFPATVIVDVSADGDGTVYLGEIPPIKPAGVGVEYQVESHATIEVSHEIFIYTSGIACGTHFCGTYPPKS